jgi:hypothetical protein
LRADYAFRGVALPAGRHQVVFTHVSWPTRIGLGLAFLGVLGLVGLGWPARRGRKRSPVV